MSETTTALIFVSGLCGTILGIAGVCAVLWKFAKPWLLRELGIPLQEVKEQVTNSHSTNLRDDITGLHDKLDEHLKWSNAETSRIWSAIDRKADRP